ncbi:DUF6266 family protein [Epilithonimonas hispanica]|uniref:Uncharacterized protein n=1 Tax=Epilithonimonas hispanica TaxID=358687 RepID=A0A3D9CVQ1_9FLAO|nr:DUF6266 family protein [Epilithonimonas hispanica]REC69832.1 hypothetical protein DRF58_11685 [Epilithonimonas hispanica]
MGKFEKGILGGFSGIVGPVVGATWRGMDILRSRPKRTHRVPTADQLLQQQKFKLAVQFLQPVRTIQSKYFGTGSGVKSRANLAVSYTIAEAIQVVAEVPELIFNKVLITRGELAGFQNATLATQVGAVLEMSWQDNSTQGNAKSNDAVSLVCYCKELKAFEIFEGIVLRSDLEAIVTLPNYCIGKTMEVYAFLNNEKETMASTSFYLGEHTVI